MVYGVVQQVYGVVTPDNVIKLAYCVSDSNYWNSKHVHGSWRVLYCLINCLFISFIHFNCTKLDVRIKYIYKHLYIFMSGVGDSVMFCAGLVITIFKELEAISFGGQNENKK